MNFKKSAILSLILIFSIASLKAKNYTEITTVKQYNDIVKSDKPSIVMFCTTHCGPCKTMEPHFDSVAKENKDITFAKVNIDTVPTLKDKKNITSVPTLVFSKKSKEYKDQRTRGSRTKKQLQDCIKQFKTSLKK